MIKILLGRQEGVVERFEDSYMNDELDRDGIPRLYIRNKLLAPYEVNVLALLIITFGIIIAITVFDIFFLDITHTCAENPKIYCFITTLTVNGSRSDLNNTNERITDCQKYWNNEDITATFTCFRWAMDFKITTAAVGGLITFFRYTVKITTGLLIACLEVLQSCSTPCCKKVVSFCAHHITKIRRVLATLVGFIEIGLAMFVGSNFVYYYNEDETDEFTNFFYKNGNQLVLFCGIIATCLLLPLEDYASSTHNLEEQPPLPHPSADDTPLSCILDKSDFTPVEEECASSTHNLEEQPPLKRPTTYGTLNLDLYLEQK